MAVPGEPPVVYPHGRVHEALIRLRAAGLTDGDLQRIVQEKDLAAKVVQLIHSHSLPEK